MAFGRAKHATTKASGSRARDAARVVKARYFEFVNTEMLADSGVHAADSLLGTRALHSVRVAAGIGVKGVGNILTRLFGCACSSCRRKEWSECENKAIVGEYSNVQIYMYTYTFI